MKILVLYYSMTGNVYRMAQLVAEGVREAGADVDIKTVPELMPEEVIDGDEAIRKAKQEQSGIPIAEPEELAEYDQTPYVPAPVPGARVFAQTLGPPGYLEADDEEQDLYGAIVGCDIINERTKTGEYRRHHPVGSQVLLTLLPMTAHGTISGEGSITLSLRYADDSRTRVYEIDNMCVYVDFSLIQSTLRMDPQELIPGKRTVHRRGGRL